MPRYYQISEIFGLLSGSKISSGVLVSPLLMILPSMIRENRDASAQKLFGSCARILMVLAMSSRFRFAFSAMLFSFDVYLVAGTTSTPSWAVHFPRALFGATNSGALSRTILLTLFPVFLPLVVPLFFVAHSMVLSRRHMENSVSQAALECGNALEMPIVEEEYLC